MISAPSPRRARSACPRVEGLEGRVVLSHIAPRADFARIAYRELMRAKAAEVQAFAGRLDGSAHFEGASPELLDQNLVSIGARGIAEGRPRSPRLGKFFVTEGYIAYDQELVPFFNGPSTTAVSTTLKFASGLKLPVDLQIHAGRAVDSKIPIEIKGEIVNDFTGEAIGTIEGRGVYDYSSRSAARSSNEIIYADGVFRANIHGEYDPALLG